MIVALLKIVVFIFIMYVAAKMIPEDSSSLIPYLLWWALGFFLYKKLLSEKKSVASSLSTSKERKRKSKERSGRNLEKEFEEKRLRRIKEERQRIRDGAIDQARRKR